MKRFLPAFYMAFATYLLTFGVYTLGSMASGGSGFGSMVSGIGGILYSLFAFPIFVIAFTCCIFLLTSKNVIEKKNTWFVVVWYWILTAGGMAGLILFLLTPR